jgi:hypothetical protein
VVEKAVGRLRSRSVDKAAHCRQRGEAAGNAGTEGRRGASRRTSPSCRSCWVERITARRRLRAASRGRRCASLSGGYITSTITQRRDVLPLPAPAEQTEGAEADSSERIVCGRSLEALAYGHGQFVDRQRERRLELTCGSLRRGRGFHSAQYVPACFRRRQRVQGCRVLAARSAGCTVGSQSLHHSRPMKRPTR